MIPLLNDSFASSIATTDSEPPSKNAERFSMDGFQFARLMAFGNLDQVNYEIERTR